MFPEVEIVKLVLSLAVAYQIKHFLCDFIFQTDYMGKGKFNEHYWLGPLTAHCLVHFIGTLLIGYAFGVDYALALSLAFVDFVSHFVIDKAKVISSRSTSFPKKSWFVLIGLDQMLHHFVHYLIIFLFAARLV